MFKRVFNTIADRFFPEVDKDIPPDIYASLVRTLFGSMKSLMAASIVGPLAGTLASLLSGNPWMIAATVAITAVSAFRVIVMLAYRRREADLKTFDDVAAWERRYGWGAVSFALMLGVLCMISFQMDDNEVAHVILAAVTIGYSAGISGRNAGRPRIAVSQILASSGPLALALIMHENAYYITLGVIIVAFFLSMREVSTTLSLTLVTALKSTKEEKNISERFDTALGNMSHGLTMFGPDRRIMVTNGRFAEILDLDEGAVVIGMSANELIETLSARQVIPSGKATRKLVADFEDRLEGREQGDLRLEIRNDRILSLRFNAMASGGSVVVLEDITDRCRSEAEIVRLAKYDSLTGLPNRHTFHEALDKAMKGDRDVAVLCVDLDKFKVVNDTLGHPIGDELLRQVAQRLRLAVREKDLVSRFGGDEFVIINYDAKTAEGVMALSNRIVERLSEPYTINDEVVRTGATIGFALGPQDATDAATLFKNADLALYRAKAESRGSCCAFDKVMDEEIRAKRVLEADILTALAESQFSLHYQPQVDAWTGKIVTCEALIRWFHPTRGRVNPVDFIKMAEESGLIVDIGHWVLRTACREALSWPSHLRVAVNLSTIQFVRGDIVKSVRDALAETGLQPHRLELEVTESVMLQNEAASLKIMSDLRALGVSLSLDDFGTGFSSLNYISDLPVQKIKIDRSFVLKMDDPLKSHKATAIIKALVAMTKELGMSVTVEGVETTDQLRRLKAIGCSHIQGYLFSPPLPTDKLHDFLRTDEDEIMAKAA